jgi:hypothetical protein
VEALGGEDGVGVGEFGLLGRGLVSEEVGIRGEGG